MAGISGTVLIDDDETTHSLNQKLLQRLAVTDTVLVSGNGEQAREWLRRPCAVASPPDRPCCCWT